MDDHSTPLAQLGFISVKPLSGPAARGRVYHNTFWGMVDKRGPDECWPWRGATGENGYGRAKIAKRLFLPHRIAYALAYGPIDPPPGYWGKSRLIMHTCDNKRCCNPGHLKMGSHSDNMSDWAIRTGIKRPSISAP